MAFKCNETESFDNWNMCYVSVTPKIQYTNNM